MFNLSYGFVRAEHSATGEDENCTYGPTLAIMFEIKASFVLIYAVLLHCCINNLEKARRRALISGSRFRAVGRSENPGGRASNNVVGIICPHPSDVKLI